MKLERKLVDLIQRKYCESTSLSRTVLVGLSLEINERLLEFIKLNPDAKIKLEQKNCVVPLVLVTSEELDIVQIAETEWKIPGSNKLFESKEAAMVEYIKLWQENYQERGYGRGDKNFAVLVRNVPDAPAVYLATSYSDFNTSIISATVKFGFQPSLSGNGGRSYFLQDDFYLSLMPKVQCTHETSWPLDCADKLGSLFDEMVDDAQGWHLLFALNEFSDGDGVLPVDMLEAILGLPNSENDRLDLGMLDLQIRLMKRMAEVLASPEKHSFYEALKSELPGHEDVVDMFAEYILLRSVSVSVEESIFETYAGVARRNKSDVFEREPWWEFFTVALLERVLSVDNKVVVKIKALNAVSGTFADKSQPLVGRQFLEFELLPESQPAPEITVYRSTKQLETNIVIPDTYEYHGCSKDKKSFKLTFEALTAPNAKPMRVSRDILLLDYLDAGCFITLGDANILKKTTAFQPSKKGAKYKFASDLVANKETNGLLQIFSGSHFRLDESSLVFIREKNGEEEKLEVDIYDNYVGVRCDLKDGAEIHFKGRIGTTHCSYVVRIGVVQQDVKSFPSVFNYLLECHLSKTSRIAPINFGAGGVASQLSKHHLLSVLESGDIIGYPLVISDDISDKAKKNVWLDSSKKATDKLFVPSDPRPSFNLWKSQCEKPEAVAYFSARKKLFEVLCRNKEFGGDIIEEYSLYLLDKDENIAIKRLLIEYLTAYNTWLEADYDSAVIVDTIWAYFSDEKTLKSCPDAIFLPPQHPLRIYWQFQAQRYMHSALVQQHYSNVVASFDSHSVPDIIHIPLVDSTTGMTVQYSFFAIPTSSDYWGVYHSYNKEFDAASIDRGAFFADWGFQITSIKRTMTAGEVESALSATQAVCIAKDALNVRYVAKNLGGSSVKLLLQKSVEFLSGKDESGPRFGPRIISIVGSQVGMPEGVTEAEIMTAREQTAGRLQWFSPSSSEQNNLKVDVTIASLGAAGITSYRMEKSPSYGAVCAGGLLRYRNRSRGVVSSCEIVESRLVTTVVDTNAEDADNVFLHALELVEGKSFSQMGNSPEHIHFNADLVSSGIIQLKNDNSHYYAVSSSDVDQACFEALKDSSDVYLWEYRLPMPGAHSSGTDGFYLLAKENPIMIQAVSEAVKSLDENGASDDAIRDMLFLSAKRGIPTVKNLASGGKNALGEVGVLVTLNALQGGVLNDSEKGLFPAHIKQDGFEYFNLLVPMDIFRERFEAVVKKVLNCKSAPTRPDIVAFSIKCTNTNGALIPICMRMSFIEVKTRRDKMTGASMEDALSQADYFLRLYSADDETLEQLYRWEKLDFLVGMLTFGFRVYESIPELLSPLVSIYPEVIAALFGDGKFLEVNSLPRLSVIHAVAKSGVLLEKNGIYRAIEISKSDGYKIATNLGVPDSIKVVGSWGLLANGDRPITPASEPVTPAPEPVTPAPEPVTPAPEPVTPILPTPESVSLHKTPSEALAPCYSGDNLEVKYQEIIGDLKWAFEEYGISTERVGTPIESPNLVLIDYKGTKTCTEAKVAQHKKVFLSTYGIDIVRVESLPKRIRLAIERDKREVLDMRDVWEKQCYNEMSAYKNGLLIAIAEDDGHPIYLNPQEENSPHTLIAGSSGSGKSVLLLNMLACLKEKFAQEDVRVYIVDPKRVDFYDFENVSNFKVLSTKNDAIEVFNNLVVEMEHRYDLLRSRKVKKISEYNALPDVERLPIIWCFHDEFADWFRDEEYQHKVDAVISSLAAKARAAGIFLVFAAQRPEAKVMPPGIRENLGIRLCLKVIDVGTSRIVLGGNSEFAEKGGELLGKGHMIALMTDFSGYCQVPNFTEK